MSKLPIVTIPDKILRQKARPVTRFDADLQRLVDNMIETLHEACLLYTSPSPRDRTRSRMPSSA